MTSPAPTPEALLRLALEAMGEAHAPYSGLRVGAAILSASGRTWSGCNVENASYPEGWCAEASAIAHMIRGGDKVISEIAVVSDRLERIAPCGGCLQRIAEFSDSSAKIHICNRERIVETRTLSSLLPDAFASGPGADESSGAAGGGH